MKQVYFDNAATTYMYDEVINVMADSMKNNIGNPSSTHQFGRKAKVALETSRKKIAKLIGANSNEIIFTSSGTEGNNLVLNNAVKNLGVKVIITSKIEHHAVLNVVENLSQEYGVLVKYVALDEFGGVDLDNLKELLSVSEEKVLVSLMMVNNEIGNILPFEEVAGMCVEYNALFHTDAVQAVGHLPIDLNNVPIDFLVASAHKFHGSKGVGFVFCRKEHVIKPMILGGNQEKGVRSSTENVHAIVGMAKALEISVENMSDNSIHIQGIKQYLCKSLKEISSKIEFNGYSSSQTKSIPKILNVRFPEQDKLLLFNLDLKGIAASSGSACQSGGIKVSHVLKEFVSETDLSKTSIRFSFSGESTKVEVDYLIEIINQFIK
ncbi:cysteine desulfurase family protein [Tenacibaculum sp. MEBiC06402]|uniref:cysteine desulfurase family protein n=1 Tax=unclassified Tenacibaculum TaxID=2635139 RepID=UPI003B98F76C